MSVFKKLTYTAEELLEHLIDELIDIQFIRDLSFMLMLDEEGESPHIDFFIEGKREDLDEYFFTLYFDESTKEFYYWKVLQIGEVEISAKVFIENIKQLEAVLNQEIKIILTKDID